MNQLVERLKDAARDATERQKFTPGCYIQAPRQRIEWEAANAITDLEALVGELGEALKLYGLHLGSCKVEKVKGQDELNNAICTCGLSATLAKLEKARD